MSYLDWHVGMKVVCILEGEWASTLDGRSYGDLRAPEVGIVYTISRIISQGGLVAIQLDELPTQHRSGIEVAFLADHFRPLPHRKTDISVFTAMLTSNKQKVEA